MSPNPAFFALWYCSWILHSSPLPTVTMLCFASRGRWRYTAGGRHFSSWSPMLCFLLAPAVCGISREPPSPLRMAFWVLQAPHLASSGFESTLWGWLPRSFLESPSSAPGNSIAFPSGPLSGKFHCHPRGQFPAWPSLPVSPQQTSPSGGPEPHSLKQVVCWGRALEFVFPWGTLPLLQGSACSLGGRGGWCGNGAALMPC